MKVHMSLPATNLEETKRFYTILFGEEPAKEKPDYLKFDPKKVPLNISFHKVDAEQNLDLTRHLGFEIESQEELERIYDKLQKEGFVSQEKEAGVCCYASQDKFWVKDPTGFEWEFYVLLKNTEAKMQVASGCC